VSSTKINKKKKDKKKDKKEKKKDKKRDDKIIDLDDDSLEENKIYNKGGLLKQYFK
jgi:hypothetical protein